MFPVLAFEPDEANDVIDSGVSETRGLSREF